MTTISRIEGCSLMLPKDEYYTKLELIQVETSLEGKVVAVARRRQLGRNESVHSVEVASFEDIQRFSAEGPFNRPETAEEKSRF